MIASGLAETDPIEPGQHSPSLNGETVNRTCTEVQPDGSPDAAHPRPLSDFRDVPAYVLLGDPGAGKTYEFTRESDELGDTARKESARSFIALDLRRPEWRNKTLFIDGLDEMRAGTTDARSPLDQIRNRIDQLRPPRFRLSCREADWLGNNDLQALRGVSPDSRIKVLRLDPLTESAARAILCMKYPALATESFIRQARQHGLHSMLGNPLTLTLLAEAVEPGGDLPESRLDTFETACKQMACEHNDEHKVAGLGQPIESLIDAAGYWCALLMFSGVEACSHGPANGLSPCVSLDDIREVIGGPARAALHAALGTKLFKGADESGFVPLHRQVAEFLAGRYLAKRISNGLPASRVVALMTGPSDGRVVTVLRGLSAWLAAHSPEARSRLVDVDPVGVALYGDIKGFTTNDKERLLRALSQLTPHEPMLGYEHSDSPFDAYRPDTAWAFRHLASSDMIEAIRRTIGREHVEPADERLEILVLGALSKAEQSEVSSLCDLLPDLLTLTLDSSRPTVVRRYARDAYRHILPADIRTQALVDLLDELHEDAGSDGVGELRGALLGELYPSHIGPSQIWRYALGPYQRGIVNKFQIFWSELAKRTPDEQLIELLDALSADASRLIPSLRTAGFVNVPLELLAQGLTKFGETLDPAHADYWLQIVGPYEQRWDVRQQSLDQIRYWLRNDPRAHRTAFLVRLRNRPAGDSPRSWGWRLLDPILRGTFPVDFGRSCLERAIEVADTEPTLSRALLTHAFVSVRDPSINDGLTLDVLRERTRGCPHLARELEDLCEEHAEREVSTHDPYLEELEELQKQRQEEERQRKQEWSQHVRLHETELRENRFSPPDLHNLASAYLGVFSDSDRQASPRHRIADFVGNDAVAIDAALAGLRGAVWREDIPNVEETISLCLESQQPWLAYPVLASLHLLDEEDPTYLDSLDDAVKRRALAIYYCVPLVYDISRRWYDRWLQRHRELVLDVLDRCAVSAIQNGQDLPSRLSELGTIDNSEDRLEDVRVVYVGAGVGPSVVGNDENLVHDLRLRLLRVFPLRGRKERLPVLDALLAEALQHPDTIELEEVIQQKLTRSSMSVGQRVRWLAFDAAISRTPGVPRLQSFVDGNETRTRHLAEVLRHPIEHLRDIPNHPASAGSILASGREAATLRTLIEMLGQFFAPTNWREYGTLEQAMSEYLRGLIGRLGSFSGDDATRALEELIRDPRLASWRGHLKWAKQRQLVVRRNDSYRHPTVDEIQRTLDGGAPANAADLAALLRDHLTDIRADIRGGNANFWRQFWNVDKHSRPEKPRPEDPCRETVLVTLQDRLPAEVDAVPEGQYAADTRADIRAASGGFNVPIEIKRNSHRELWSAIRTQLIAKYTTDPATSGYGIYLVLWFGADETVPGPDGDRPAAPAELEQNLANTLTPDEARKVSVIVLDVTKPGDDPR